jgi:hypothetical protein
MLRNASSTNGEILFVLIALAGCGSSGQSPVEQDAAATTGDVAMVAETGPTPQTAPTLETGVDEAALAAAVTPQVIQFTRATQPDAAVADTIQLGRPWGEFDVHKGPRLVFRGSWRLLAAISGDYFAVVGVVRDGDSYKMISIGSAVAVPTMVAREQLPAVSAALDRGRAGFLRCIGEGGDSLLAYEAETVADAGHAEIRVQPLGGDRRSQGIDASADGVVEMSLDELNPMLPDE